MKKIFSMILFATLTMLVVTGCNKLAVQEDNTDVLVSGDKSTVAVDAKSSEGISDASDTSNTLDTSQVDTTLSLANSSLANW